MLKKIAASLTSILLALLLQIVDVAAALALDARIQLAFQPDTAGHQDAVAEECAGSLSHDADAGDAVGQDLEAQPSAAAQHLADGSHQHDGEGVADAHADAVQCRIDHSI